MLTYCCMMTKNITSKTGHDHMFNGFWEISQRFLHENDEEIWYSCHLFVPLQLE